MNPNHLALLLSALKAGSASFKPNILVPVTKLNLQCLHLLYRKGWIRGFFYNSYNITVFLKFDEELKPTIKSIQGVSTGGKSVYVSHKELCRLSIQSGTLVLTTTRGIITGEEARDQFQIGGKILFKII